MTEKIRPTHLERTAYVYVRQSTAQQVRHHQEGQQRQYTLAAHAHHLGFQRTQVIDDDPAAREAEGMNAPASPGGWRPSAKVPPGPCSRSKPRGWPGTTATGTIWSISAL